MDRWSFERVTKRAQIEEAFEVYASNPAFFICSQDSEATLENVLSDMRDLPKGLDAGRKHFVLCRYRGKAAAMIDLLDGYPDGRTLYVGLFMIHGAQHGHGLGSSLLGEIERRAQGQFDRIRLCVLRNNAPGLAFWRQMGFQAARITRFGKREVFDMIKQISAGAPAPMRIHAALWDLDGTLLNTLEDLAASTNAALAAHGMPERTLEEVRGFVGNGVAKLIERAVPPGTGKEKTGDVLSSFLAYYAEHDRDHTRPYGGVMPLLETLAARGVKLAVVSNKIEPAVKALCAEYFGDVIQTAVGDAPERPRKPAPDGIYEAMRRLEVSAEECVYIGDSDVDVQTARNAGLRSIAVTWGFRDEALLRAAGADFICHTADDLMSVLETL